MLEIKEKKIRLGDKEAVIKMGEYAHQAKVAVNAFFIIGLPGSTLISDLKTVDFAKNK